MKLIFVLALCSIAPVAIAAAYVSDDTSAGSYGGKSYGRAPTHAEAPSPESAPYTAPASAPYAASSPAPYTASDSAPYAAPANGRYKNAQKMEHEGPVEGMCWTETKKCCWKRKTDGYECKDDYVTKQARCHPKFKYERKCNKAKDDEKPDKPKSCVNYGETETIYYDPNYGPHVEGYPSGGVSDTYESKQLPQRPYGVEAEPYKYVAPTASPYYSAPGGAGYDTGYSRSGNGYAGAPAPTSTEY